MFFLQMTLIVCILPQSLLPVLETADRKPHTVFSTAPCVDLSVSGQHSHMVISTRNLLHWVAEEHGQLPGLQNLRTKCLGNTYTAIVV